MSSCLVKLNPKRTCRYVFVARLWNGRLRKYDYDVKVLLDTGSFNTVIHESLVEEHGKMLKSSMMTSVGGYKGMANLCVINEMDIGGLVLEQVVALAVPFEGELRDHILLGTNVTNNWKFTVSRVENNLEITEQFSSEALLRNHPYRYCYDNKGRVMALQEMGEIA